MGAAIKNQTPLAFPPLFTALHVMQTRSSDENSVRLSVCLSNAWTVIKRKICSDFYTIRKII